MRDPLKAASEETKAGTWPPKPIKPYVQQTVLVQSKEMLGLLTDFFLLDFFLGLVLGIVGFFLLLLVFGCLAGWAVPTLPVPQSVLWFDWGATTLGTLALFVFFVRRYIHLMIGFIATALVLAAVGFIVVC